MQTCRPSACRAAGRHPHPHRQTHKRARPRRGSYDLTGRVYASGAMGTPLCLSVLSGDAGERVVYGDTEARRLLSVHARLAFRAHRCGLCS